MKQLVFKTITSDLLIIGTIPPDRIFQRYGPGVNTMPEQPEKPFMLISELPSFPPRQRPKVSRANTHYFQFFVFDEKGSYQRIDEVLDEVVDITMAMVGERSVTQRVCLHVEEETRSQDYIDDAYDAFVKHVTMQVVGSSKIPVP